MPLTYSFPANIQSDSLAGTGPATPDHELVNYKPFYSRHRAKVSQHNVRKNGQTGKSCSNDQTDEMKFSRSIQFNAVPDWSSQYIAYSNLKKVIYRLEKDVHRNPGTDDLESSSLISAEEDPDRVIQRALNVELEKICAFYRIKEKEIFGVVANLLKEIEKYQSNLDQAGGQDAPTTNHNDPHRRSTAYSIFWGSRFGAESTMSRSTDESSDDDDSNENTALRKSITHSDRNRSVTSEAANKRNRDSLLTRLTCQADSNQNETVTYSKSTASLLKKQVITVYVQLCELNSFLQLNRTGFLKLLKKYDKIIGRSLKFEYMKSHVDVSEPYRTETAQRLKENIDRIESIYASLFTNNDLVLAKRELILNVREQVVWERNTVWREMVGIERKTQAARVGLRTILGADHELDLKPLGNGEIRRSRFPRWLFNSTAYYLLGIFIVFIGILLAPINLKSEQHNCLAMLITVSLLWATEVIPLFATSLMIPVICVVLRVVRSDEEPHERLYPHDAARYMFAAMWTPVILLMLGGLTIAAALTKHDIARRIATAVLSKAGDKPKVVLLATMFVAAFFSMWISNIAASVLCFSITQPLLRNLPSDSPVSKSIVLGIALASNIGGMLSPISSPQNIIALQIMQPPPSWGVWFFIALPVGVISILLIWLILVLSFQDAKGTKIVPLRPVVEKFGGVQLFVSIVTLVTIALWCMGHQLEWMLGDMGVVAIIPMILFFGSGVLTSEDFNNLLWTLIILAAGGLSLGKAVDSSGLLHTIAKEIAVRIHDLHIYSVLVIFSILIITISTFVSHAIAALILLPLLYKVGLNLEDPHPNLLVMGGTLICTAAMGLPTSSFPNMTAVMLENPETGHRYLQVKHFLTRGFPSSFISVATILTVGYALMLVVGM